MLIPGTVRHDIIHPRHDGRRRAVRLRLILCLAVGLTAAVSTEALAQGAILHATDTVLTRQIRSLEDITLAHRLAVYGQRARMPLALATAAGILLANPTRPLGAPTPDTVVDGAVLPDPRRLLASARSLATGDDRMLAIIRPLEQRAADVPRGSASGPRQLYGRVASAMKREHLVEFRGNQPAVIYVSGEGDSDLDVFVYNSSGQLVASATGPRDECIVHWIPERQESFRVEVRNVGLASNWYWMATN